jgi:hypothetical protein
VGVLEQRRPQVGTLEQRRPQVGLEAQRRPQVAKVGAGVVPRGAMVAGVTSRVPREGVAAGRAVPAAKRAAIPTRRMIMVCSGRRGRAGSPEGDGFGLGPERTTHGQDRDPKWTLFGKGRIAWVNSSSKRHGFLSKKFD